MSAYKALDLYFKAKDLQGHFDTLKSIHVYSKKLEKASDVHPKDLQFFKSGRAVKANKGLKNALRVYQGAAKNPPEWPRNNTEQFFDSMLKSSEKFGVNSQSTKNTQKNYLNKCIYFGKQLDGFWAELKEREAKIAKHLKLCRGLQGYCQDLRKTFYKIARIPSVVTSAEQGNWVELSEDAVVMTGHASSCVSALERLDRTNAKTLKECRELMKSNQMWIKWIKSAAVNKPGAIQKNRTAKTPK